MPVSKPSPSESRRSEILDAVMRILAKQGVDELTFERIGKEAGMARSHVVYYFQNREALVKAAIEFAAASAQGIIEAELAEGEGVDDRLRRYVRGNFEWIRRHPEHATVYTLLYYLACFKAEYRELHDGIREAGARRIERILEKGHWKPRARRGLAKAIQAIVTGNILDVMTTNRRGELAAALRDTLLTVERLVR